MADKKLIFDEVKFKFPGTAIEEALALLRPVLPRGGLGPKLAELPAPLATLVGQPVTFTKAKLRAYLVAIKASESHLGGSLDDPLSRGKNNSSKAPTAKYFVIHDTSTPNFGKDDFPANINTAAWKYNDLAFWQKGSKSKAHVFTNRVGGSVTAVPFSKPWRATKFELEGEHSATAKGLFLNIENTQPRKADLKYGSKNDHLAPTPGFPTAQYDRLALIYVCASCRKGEWLIPAYHRALDVGFAAHDDPQKFDLTEWCAAIQKILDALKA